MEILSRMMTRADSGTGVRQRAGPGTEGGSRFDRIFEEALTDSEPLMHKKKPDTKAADRDTVHSGPKKPDDDNIAVVAFAAGALGNLNEVAFILEGDMESATNPELHVEAAAGRTELPESPGEKPGTVPTHSKAEPGDTDAEAAKTAVIPTEDTAARIAQEDTKTQLAPGTQEALKTPNPEDSESRKAQNMSANPVTAEDLKAYENLKAFEGRIAQKDAEAYNGEKHAENPAGAANAETAAKPETAGAQSNIYSLAGEVTARTPGIRTPDHQENTERDASFSRYGSPSHLENENDTVPVKGQKEKSYSETANAVRNAAENAQEPVNNTPPLSEGIKPEQFRADQQMKQAAPNAPVRPENLFDEMVSRIQTNQTETSRTMTIQLKPEFLGKVALEIAIDAAGLHVKIDAADSGVRSMINGQLNALIESLENKGIEVAKVEVTYTGVDNGAHKEPQDGRSQSNRQKRANQETDPADGIAYYTALPIEMLEYYREAGVSSVEYSA